MLMWLLSELLLNFVQPVVRQCFQTLAASPLIRLSLQMDKTDQICSYKGLKNCVLGFQSQASFDFLLAEKDSNLYLSRRSKAHPSSMEISLKLYIVCIATLRLCQYLH